MQGDSVKERSRYSPSGMFKKRQRHRSPQQWFTGSPEPCRLSRHARERGLIVASARANGKNGIQTEKHGRTDFSECRNAAFDLMKSVRKALKHKSVREGCIIHLREAELGETHRDMAASGHERARAPPTDYIFQDSGADNRKDWHLRQKHHSNPLVNREPLPPPVAPTSLVIHSMHAACRRKHKHTPRNNTAPAVQSPRLA